jgi:hypothetical protein
LANVLFDVIFPSVLGFSLWSFGQGFPIFLTVLVARNM